MALWATFTLLLGGSPLVETRGLLWCGMISVVLARPMRRGKTAELD